MTAVLTPDQVAVVRTIAAEMIGKALRGADQRIKDSITVATDETSPYAPLNTHQRVRLQCLKLAVSLQLPGWPVREVAGGLADFILCDVRTEPDRPVQPAAEATAVDQRAGA